MKLLSFIILFIKNMSNYGYLNSIKIIFYELIYFKGFKDYKLIENKDTSYLNSKIKNVYNTGYLPTPYYFLVLFKKYLKKNKIKKFNFIDLGCGFSRPALFLYKFFDIKYLGFEINKKLIRNNTKKKSFKFFNINLRNSKKLLDILRKNIKSHQINIFFICDPFDILLVNKILKMLKKIKLINRVVLININFNKLKKNNFKLDLIQKFNKRNMYILKNRN